MPPIKRKKQKIQQKKQITKRLMEISIKVDKYIYKHKPIPVALAEIYLQEVMSYKTLCFGDVRLLQVIEKLTCFLNVIIEETKSKNICMSDSESRIIQNEIGSCMASPVYSTADEDRTQIPEEIFTENNTIMDTELNTNSKNGFKDNVIEIPSCRSPLANSISRITTPCTDNFTMDDQTAEHELINSVNDLTLDDTPQGSENAMSSQSLLKDLEETNRILNNANGQSMREIDKEIERIMKANDHAAVKGKKKNTQNELNPTKKYSVQYETGKSYRILTDTLHENNEYTCPQTKLKKYAKACLSDDNLRTSTNVKIENNNTKRNENVLIHTRNTLDVRESQNQVIAIKTGKVKSVKPKANESFKIQKEFAEMTRHDTKSKKLNQSINKKKPLKKDRALNNSKMKEKRNKPKAKSSKNTTSRIKVSNDTFISTNISDESCQDTGNVRKLNPNIRKKYLVEDLSWVENIKYIRIIHQEEYDPALNSLTSTFWDNCLLPENLDDRDLE